MYNLHLELVYMVPRGVAGGRWVLREVVKQELFHEQRLRMLVGRVVARLTDSNGHLRLIAAIQIRVLIILLILAIIQ